MEIFVGNLPFDVTEREVLDAFSKYGEVSGIKMLKDKKTGRFRGIAFVSMPDNVQANTAIDSLNNTELGGRPMRVDRSRERFQRFNGFGAGFRRDGNSGKFVKAKRRFRKDYSEREKGESVEGRQFAEDPSGFKLGRVGDYGQKSGGFHKRRFNGENGAFEDKYDKNW